MASIFDNAQLSLLSDDPRSLVQAGRRAATEDRMIRNEVQEVRRFQRLGRRAYRDALRRNDFAGAMDALDWAQSRTGSTGAGIQTAGNLENNLRAGFNQTRQAVDQYNGQFPRTGNVGLLDDQGAGIEMTGPPAPAGTIQPDASNVRARISLFDRMLGASASGNDLSVFRGEANLLGVDDQSFARGAARALQRTLTPSVARTTGGALYRKLFPDIYR